MVVGLAEGHAGLDAAAGQPHGEAARMMVAAVVVGRQLALAVDRAAELAAPHHQRVVEQPALLADRPPAPPTAGRCPGTGRRSAWAGARAGPSRDGTAARIARRARTAAAPAGSWRRTCPASATRGRTARNVRAGSSETFGQFGHDRLHAIGHLVLRDARGDLRIADTRRASTG